MQKFKFLISIYFLPIFFFTLAISPNINSARIGLVLLSVFILLIPATNYIADNPGKRISNSGDIKYSFIDSLALIMIILAIYLGWKINWQFSLLQGLYLFAVVLIARQERFLSPDIKWFISKSLQGMLLFSTIYLGLNQYGFNNLLRAHIILFASLTTLIIIIGLYIVNLREYSLLQKDELVSQPQKAVKPLKIILILIILLLLAYAGFFTATYHWRYAGFIALALMPSILFAIILLKRFSSLQTVQMTAALQWLNIILSTCLVIFFIYFFLDSTQVLQAIRGGY